MLEEYKKYIKSNFPCLIRAFVRIMQPIERYKLRQNENKLRKLIQNIALEHNKALSRSRYSNPLRCVFFVIYYQTWKYEKVYRLMVNNPRFEPIVLICPACNYGHEKMVQHMHESYEYFKREGYQVLISYNEGEETYLDVAKDLNPDIIFYTNPYRGLIDNRYYITNFLNTLTVYVPYAFNNNINYEFCQNQILHNLVWRYYAETEEHVNYSKLYSDCKGCNVVNSGYPGIEVLIDNHIPSDKDWKIQGDNIKKLIWAPHHTVETKGTFMYSCFLKYAEFFFTMADKYKDRIQIAFKPHPLLKDKLDVLWGKEKSDNYYDRWRSGANTSFVDGNYADLFLTSDAMIHDSGSFLVEYLYVNKPVMRTINEEPLEELYNPFALKCLEQYYMAKSEIEIEQFIVNVINGVDPLKGQRTNFVNDVLMPKGSPSQNIIDDILDSIDNQILYRN